MSRWPILRANKLVTEESIPLYKLNAWSKQIDLQCCMTRPCVDYNQLVFTTMYATFFSRTRTGAVYLCIKREWSNYKKTFPTLDWCEEHKGLCETITKKKKTQTKDQTNKTKPLSLHRHHFKAQGSKPPWPPKIAIGGIHLYKLELQSADLGPSHEKHKHSYASTVSRLQGYIRS